MKTLKDYLKDYLAWVDSGAPDMQPFFRAIGLCFNVMKGGYTEDEAHIKYELRNKLLNDYGTDEWTFGYGAEADCHRNPDRIAWIRRTLEELP